MGSLKEKIKEILDEDLLWLASFLPPYKKMISAAVFFMILAGLASSLIAKLLGQLTDLGFYNKNSLIVLLAPIALILVSVMHGGSMFMSNYLLGNVSQNLLNELRKKIFHKILRWPSQAYQANSTGMVSSKFVLEANFWLSSATKSFIILVRDTIQVLALSIMLIWHNVMLSLVCLIIGPLVYILLRYISRKLKKVMESNQLSIASLLVAVREAYEAEKLIKISNTFKKELKKFEYKNNQIKKLNLNIAKISSLGTPVTQLICMLGVAVVLGVAMIQTSLELLSIGDFVTFLAALLLLMPPLRHLAGLNSSLVMMKVAAKSLHDTLKIPEERNDGRIELSECRGNVSFENVSLRYPGESTNAVTNFNLNVQAGEVIALVGQSGSGKTSLVNMIPRFWNPTAGKITIDGIDTQELTLESLRKNISAVSQDIILFDGTIKQNIIYGTPTATDNDIREAVKAAALNDFIKDLPNGIDTQIGEAGDRLSGGQKQRISIARALLKDAPILILDEATSALDSVSENHIKRAISILMEGRTTFIVAHRLSTIDQADKIVVLEKGFIKELGTKDELLRKKGEFYKLYNLQRLSNWND